MSNQNASSGEINRGPVTRQDLKYAATNEFMGLHADSQFSDMRANAPLDDHQPIGGLPDDQAIGETTLGVYRGALSDLDRQSQEREVRARFGIFMHSGLSIQADKCDDAHYIELIKYLKGNGGCSRTSEVPSDATDLLSALADCGGVSQNQSQTRMLHESFRTRYRRGAKRQSQEGVLSNSGYLTILENKIYGQTMLLDFFDDGVLVGDYGPEEYARLLIDVLYDFRDFPALKLGEGVAKGSALVHGDIDPRQDLIANGQNIPDAVAMWRAVTEATVGFCAAQHELIARDAG